MHRFRMLVTVAGLWFLTAELSTRTIAAPPVASTTQTTPAATAPAATQATTEADDDQKQLEACWADLAKQEPWNSRALLDFADKPVQAVAFFKTHLKPLKIDQKDLDDALAALGSDDEKVWKPAFEKLKYFDPRLNKSVETLFDDVTDPTARSRLASLLTGCDVDQWKGYDVSYSTRGNWSYLSMTRNGSQRMYGIQNKVSELIGGKSDWQRADRALVLLQHIGTPEAISVLKEMAAGNPAAEPTKVAKVALESLGESPK